MGTSQKTVYSGWTMGHRTTGTKPTDEFSRGESGLRSSWAGKSLDLALTPQPYSEVENINPAS